MPHGSQPSAAQTVREMHSMEPFTFTCSICGEPSHDICIYCTKDACANHLCDRCKKCSDCCECEAPLSHAAHEERESAAVSNQP